MQSLKCTLNKTWLPIHVLMGIVIANSSNSHYEHGTRESKDTPLSVATEACYMLYHKS